MLGKGNRKKGGLGSGVHRPPRESPSLAHRRQRFQRLFVATAFIVSVAALTELLVLRDQTGRYDIEAETVASQTIQASFGFDAIDLEATREKREEAAAQVPVTYSVDHERVKSQLLTLQLRINTLQDRRGEIDAAIREALLSSTSLESKNDIVHRVVADLAEKWKEDPFPEGFPEAAVLTTWLTPRLDSIPTRRFAEQDASTEDRDPAEDRDIAEDRAAAALPVEGLEEPESESLEFANMGPLTTLALEGLEYILTFGVIQPDTMDVQAEDAPRVRILRGHVVGDIKPGEELLLEDVSVPSVARTALGALIAREAKALEANDAEKAIDWAQVPIAAFEMASSGVTDTLFPDRVVTEGNRATARDSVEEAPRRIGKDQIIQREGDLWTQQSRAEATEYWKEVRRRSNKPARSIVSPVAANMIFVALILMALTQGITVLSTKRFDPYKAINLVLLIMCATLVLGRIISTFEPSGLVVPITSSAILLAILINARVAAFVSLLMALLLSIQYNYSWQLLMVSGAMSFAGISSIYVVRRRGDMAGAAIKATVVGLFTVLAIRLASDSLMGWATLNMLVKIALNGGVCLFIVPGLLSPLERLFGITTDIQLLEYSDLNNEILSRLAIEVPATYAHSLMIGQLAEAAADAIGANGLLARVCAYYHDIGKLRRPEYFSENQAGQNIHDDLSPRLSSRAIASHVAEGVEIAREFHLPEPIIDGILEHHGTLLISFFYQQALDQQKHGDVREEDYRYPGPKPQSRETAILMVCDAVESGVRSIKNPNEERVSEFVDKIVQSRSEDRQFDECEITLKELDVIGETLTKRMMTSLHTRIAYPEKPAEETADNVIPLSGGWD